MEEEDSDRHLDPGFADKLYSNLQKDVKQAEAVQSLTPDQLIRLATEVQRLT